MIARSLNPLNWHKTMGNTYGRSELADYYCDEILFHGATFGDLTKLPTPMTVVSGTDISTGARTPSPRVNTYERVRLDR